MKIFHFNRASLALGIFLIFAAGLTAQESPSVVSHLKSNYARLGLQAADVVDIKVQNSYKSKHNGVQHTWIQQYHRGIPVFNALIGMHEAPNGKMYNVGHRFVDNVSAKANTQLPALAAHQAVERAMAHLAFDGFKVPSMKEKVSEISYVFEGGSIARSDIQVSAVYVPIKNNTEMRLAWMVIFDQANTPDVWNIRIDALTGEVLEKNNRTVYCKHDKALLKHNHEACVEAAVKEQQTAAERGVMTEQYRVIALPAQSPNHGPHELVTAPADMMASPFGWHDTNGAPGAEFTNTRGNNVHAYEDLNDSNSATGQTIDGGTDLVFDFPFSTTAEPEDNLAAAVTNLFYMNNMIHDIFYHYGFDEAAGNFQENNYGNGGNGSDGVNAEALDGGGTNNANFSTPADGGNGRMQMYTWSVQAGNVLNINNPASISGLMEAEVPTWGGGVNNNPVTGDVVIIDDGTSEGSLGCGQAVNDLTDKIVLIDRGSCEFGRKALNAENGGAAACIVCNYDDSGMGMGPGVVGNQVSIPVLGLTNSQCNLMKAQLGQGVNVTIVRPTVTGPAFLDGDLDNGIIAHEYGHGISNRLTGGGNNSDCLGNGEQMGEGWSDFFTLVTTTREGDSGETPHGVGTYVERQGTEGRGIRRFPYSTDMSISPVTYGTVAENTGVHAIGEVWNAMVWDLYWALVEKHGFDEDLITGTAGNNRAIQLVMDGMKLQPCNPGFVDGRDAILLADVMNYNGEDTCLIHEVFARRGLGYLAQQNSTFSGSDGFEHFDPMPFCIKELKIAKASTPFIQPGEDATFTITVQNHKAETATNVIVSDEVPTGMVYQAGSASNGGTFANGMVTWELGDMTTRTAIELSYVATAGPGVESTGLFSDGMDNDVLWLPTVLDNTLTNPQIWGNDTADKQEGTASFFMPDANDENDGALEYLDYIEVTGDQPVLRFWTKVNTPAGANAGFVEITNDDGQSWTRFNEIQDFRNGYTGPVQYGTLAIPFLDGFSGNSNGWKQAYFDMEDYVGQTVRLRYRFGSDENTNGVGWWVDHTELIDMVNFNTEACVTADGDPGDCAIAPERGTIVNTDGSVGAEEEVAVDLSLSILPNPVADVLSIRFGSDLAGDTRAEVYSLDGRLTLARSLGHVSDGQISQLDMSRLPAGTYVLRLVHENGVAVRTVVKQ